MSDFEIHLPAIRGVQAGRPFFLAICLAKHLARLIPLDSVQNSFDSPLVRMPDRNRSQEISRYLTANPGCYILPAITCLVAGAMHFDEHVGKGHPSGSGTLRVPLESTILILDGVNRRAGIEMALKQRPELGDEAIPVLLFVDSEYHHAEQLLSDIRRNGSKSARSQGILCDFRDENARLSRELIDRVDVFAGMTETTRSTISNRSLKLFTLSGIYHATEILFSSQREAPYADRLSLAVQFWTEVSRLIPDWRRAKAREVSPADLRKSYVHAHAIALASLARAGRSLFQRRKRSWRQQLLPLRSLDWARSNTSLWEGRAMIAGRISKTNVSVVLVANVIKKRLNLPLEAEEQAIEERWSVGRG
jgi:DNA sulfur modification protein DndB